MSAKNDALWRAWGLAWRFLAALMGGLLAAAILGHLLRPFLFVVFLGSATAAVIGILLMGPAFLRSWKVQQRTAGHLIRGVSALALFSSAAFVLSFGPLNVDRSFSVWMLKRVSDSSGMTPDQLRESVATFFAPDSGEVTRRIDEQLLLRNINVENGTVVLTPSGEIVVRMNELISRLFGLNPLYAQGDELSQR